MLEHTVTFCFQSYSCLIWNTISCKSMTICLKIADATLIDLSESTVEILLDMSSPIKAAFREPFWVRLLSCKVNFQKSKWGDNN